MAQRVFESERSARGAVAHAAHLARELAGVDAGLNATAELLEQAAINLDEAERELEHYSGRLGADTDDRRPLPLAGCERTGLDAEDVEDVPLGVGEEAYAHPRGTGGEELTRLVLRHAGDVMHVHVAHVAEAAPTVFRHGVPFFGARHTHAAEVIDGKASALVRGSAFQACSKALTASWIPAGRSAASADCPDSSEAQQSSARGRARCIRAVVLSMAVDTMASTCAGGTSSGFHTS